MIVRLAARNMKHSPVPGYGKEKAGGSAFGKDGNIINKSCTIVRIKRKE